MLSKIKVFLKKLPSKIKGSLKKLKSASKYIFEALRFIYNPISDIKHNFNKLTPIILPKNDSYLLNLNWAINQNNLINIGLSGPYGSGKSSILDSYKFHYANNKVLKVSLASFNNEGENDEIELKILQQLLFNSESQKLTKFRHFDVFENRKKKKFEKALLIVGLISSVIFFLRNEIINIFFYGYTLFVISIISAVIFLVCIIWLVVSFYEKVSINNIKLPFIEAELYIKSHDKSSVLNTHIKEILYFLVNSKFEIIVFEDLDRLEDGIEIITKIREISHLVENLLADKKRKITFIYAVKDDLFQKENTRTKFFDYIIPTIPVISYSNSKSELIKILITENNRNRKVDLDFLKSIYYHISDMRVLYNITNEFFVYQDKLESKIENIDLNKLLALIVYKNLHSLDFEKLYNKKSEIDKIFDNKNSIILLETKSLNDKIIKVKNDLEYLSKRIELDIIELRSIYLSTIFRKVPNNKETSIILNHNIFISVYQLFVDYTSDENFKKLKDSVSIKVNDIHNNEFKFKDIESEINFYIGYEERENQIRENISKEEKELKREFKDLNFQLLEVKNSKICHLYNKNSSILDGFLDNQTLLKQLIVTGYIDETYSDYLSYFYSGEGEISQNDKSFYFSVMRNNILDVTYPLENAKMVLEDLHGFAFQNEAILNVDLIKYILKENIDDGNVNKIFMHFNTLNDNKRDFLDSFKYVYIKKLNQRILRNTQNYISELIRNNQSDFIAKDTFILDILKNHKFDDFKNQDDLHDLTNYLNENDGLVLGHDFIDKDLIMENLISLNIKFNKLSNFDYFSKEIILDNKIYAINELNIISLSNGYLTVSELEKFNSANIDFILTNEKGNHFKYLIEDDYINYYFENFLLINFHLPPSFSNFESFKAITFILDNQIIDSRFKESYLRKQKNKIQNLLFIDEDNIKDAFKYRIIEASYQNLFYYYLENDKLDNLIIVYYNSNYDLELIKNLELSKLGQKDKDKISSFENEVIICEKFNIDLYSEFQKVIENKYEDLDLSELPLGHFIRVMDEDNLVFNEVNLSYLENTEYLYKAFIIRHIDEFLDNYNQITNPNIDFITDFIQDEAILIKNKLKLIELESSRIFDLSYSNFRYIFPVLLNSADLSFLDSDELGFLFQNMDSYKDQINILNKVIDNFDKTEIVNILSKSCLLDIQKLSLSRKSNLIPYEEGVETLLNKLKLKNIVSTFENDKVLNQIKVNTRNN